MSEQKYLISIAIGPVQDFIASARRSRDLWFGSWLLSELSKAAASKIAHGDKDRLIFPAINDFDDLEPGSDFNVVNKITAVIAIEKDEVQKFAEDVCEAMECRLRKLRNDTFKRFETDEYFDRACAEKQIADLLEFYWAAVPLPDENLYSTVRLQVEALLTARKNTRNFASTKDWAQLGVPKSSLDGLRESIIKKKAYDELGDEKRRQLFETRPGERLCGIGLLKRLGNWNEQEGFFSTSHIAAFPLLSNLQDSHAIAVKQYFDGLNEIDRSAWSGISGNDTSEIHKRIRKVFRKDFQHYKKPCDGRLLFEDRLAEYFEKGEKEKIKKAKEALRKFLKDALGDRKPNPYYALLLADGDGMGKAIEALTLPGLHRDLSSKLSDFAKSVRAIVETAHHGSLIYAGGDDVLAFVPLHTIVQCAKALSDKFKTTVVNGTTLSIGVAICHHLDPLSDALTLAREAEKEAKRFPNKNALCVKLDKRGGETTTVVDHWDKLDERLNFFTLMFVADKLPDGVAYEFQKLAHQLELVPDAIAGEVERILKRKRAGHGKDVLDEAVSEKVQAALTDLGKIKGLKNPLEQLAQELIVARALATAQEQSHATLELAQKNAQQELAKQLAISNASDNKDGGDNANLDH
jgi:CRISPR-associated protein Cmr2